MEVAQPQRMKTNGFTIVELLIVIVIIAILAGLLLPALVEALTAAKDQKALTLIRGLGLAGKMYERDHGCFPPSQMDAPFSSGPAAYALSKPGSRSPAYFPFQEGDVTEWPMSPNSQIVNPANPETAIHYRNNSARPRPAQSITPYHRSDMDWWCENRRGTPTGINNWGKPE